MSGGGKEDTQGNEAPRPHKSLLGSVWILKNLRSGRWESFQEALLVLHWRLCVPWLHAAVAVEC